MGELELRAVLIALHTFAHLLAGASVLFKVDNEEAHYALEKRSAKLNHPTNAQYSPTLPTCA